MEVAEQEEGKGESERGSFFVLVNFSPVLPRALLSERLEEARANQSANSLGKWKAKLKTGKFRPGIAFTIFTNQFIYRKTAAKA